MLHSNAVRFAPPYREETLSACRRHPQVPVRMGASYSAERTRGRADMVLPLHQSAGVMGAFTEPGDTIARIESRG